MLTAFLRRLSVRRRIIGSFVILLLFLALSLPLITVNQLALTSRIQTLTNVEAKSDRLLLSAQARVLSSRVNLVRYTDDLAASPSDAQADVKQAMQLTEQARNLIASPQQKTALANVLAGMVSYSTIISDVQTARTENNGQDISPLLSSSFRLENDLEQQIQGVVTKNEALIDATNSAVLAQAQQRLILLVAGYVILLIVVVALAMVVQQSVTRPLADLRRGAEDFLSRRKGTSIPVEGTDELSLLSRTFNQITTELAQTLASLQERVAAATRNLLTASEVGRSVGQVQDLNTLLKNAVDLIRERFNLYYTQVYLLDPAGRRLVLRAGTGDVGRQLMSSQHALPLDLASLNGTAAMESRSVVVEDTEKSAIHRRNPLLPDTRSEMVIPLVIGNRLVGTLDIQSAEAGSLNEANRPAFEALAGQLAIAVQNATLLADAAAARADLEAQTARMVRSRWQDFLNAVDRSERIGFTYDLTKVDPCNEPIPQESGDHALLVPIPVLNEPVGVLKFEGDLVWKADDAALADTVAHQLGQQVENLRLIAQADQYRAEAEQTLVRLTREGWDAQFAAHQDEPAGFAYDLNTITPLPAAGDDGPQSGFTQTLEVRGEKIGALSVSGSKEAQAEVSELLSVVGEQLSARLENLRLFEESERSQLEVERRARQLAAVAEVSTVSAGELDVDKMLHSVVSRTQRKFGLYHAHIFLFDEKSNELRIAACGWEEGDTHEGTDGTMVISMAQEHSLVARAARTGQPVIVNDVHNDPDWLPNPTLPKTAAEMAVPLLIGNQVLGVLDVQSDRVNAFSEEDASIQTTLASQVAIALQNARSFEQAQRQARRETALNTISQQIQGATTVDAVLQIAARELGRALGAPLTIAQLGLKETTAVGPDGHNGHHG